MYARIVSSILVIVSTFVAGQEEFATTLIPFVGQGLEVDVYYEALCPDSQAFFNKQLQPNIPLIRHNKVKLNLIPFGKAKHEFDESTQTWKSTCRHTPIECEGHKVQACALELTENVVILDYISCLMKRGAKNKPYPGKQCADDYKQIDYPAIEKCTNSSRVEELLEDFKNLTSQLRPPVQSVPVIVFNKVFQQDDQKLAENNFKEALCRYIKMTSPNEASCSSGSPAKGHKGPSTSQGHQGSSTSQGHTLTATLLLSALSAIFSMYFL